MKNAFTILVMLSGVLLALASCSEEIKPEDDNQTPVVRIEKIGVKTEALTKVSLDGTTFSWNDGDEIAVWTGRSDTGGYFQNCSVSSNSITVMLEEGASRRNYAVYPASAKDGFDYGQSTLNVKLPATYSFSEILDTKTPLPMIAANTAGNSLSFYNVAGLFRVTVKAIPDDATGLVFEFPGKKVNGTFSVQNPSSNTPTISTGAPASGENKITVTFPAKPMRTVSEYTFNIPLPTGNYGDVYITPIGSATKVAAVRHIKNVEGGYTAARARGVKLTATLVSFSVSSTKKVIFSPGNLWATGTTSSSPSGGWTWSFAPNQYDYIGNAVANTSITSNTSKGTISADGTIDLFAWSTDSGDNYYGIHRNNGYSNSGTFRDWGTNVIASYPTNFWRTLSGGQGTSPDYREWWYVFKVRTNANSLKRWIQIGETNGVKGYILMPDGWSGTIDSNNDGICPIDEWNVLQDQGAIFLPAAGTRRYDNGNIIDVNNRGYYQTSSSLIDGANYYVNILALNYSAADPNSNTTTRGNGYSVRLVHDL